MSVLGWLLGLLVGGLVAICVAVGIDLAKEECRGQFNRFPRLVVCLAARLQRPDDRQEFREEWTANIAAIASETEDVPITRFVRSMLEAFRCVSASVRIWVEIGWPSRIGPRRKSVTASTPTATTAANPTQGDVIWIPADRWSPTNKITEIWVPTSGGVWSHDLEMIKDSKTWVVQVKHDPGCRRDD